MTNQPYNKPVETSEAQEEHTEPATTEETEGVLEEALSAFTGSGQAEAKERIAALETEVAQLKDAVLRARAEAENVRKRAQKDVEESSKYAITGFARDLVNIIENLQRASESIPEGEREHNELLKTLGVGVDMTMQEFLATLDRHGVKRIDPLGEPFDHNYHQAVVQLEDAQAEPGTVVQVIQAGYMIHDRLLRPAMVGVAKPPSGQPQNISSVDTEA